MAVPDWVLVVLVGYPLVQVPLAFYLARWFDLDGESPAPTPGRSCWAGEGGEAASLPVEVAPGQCRHCGAENDPAFTFCGSCLTRL